MRSLLVSAAMMAVALAGCTGGGGDPDSAFSTPPKDDQGRYVIQLTADNKMVPARAIVPVGATVVWKSAGFHDVTSDGGPEAFTSDAEFSSKMREGDEYARKFPTAGDYSYKCAVHGTMMTALLRVK